MAHDILDGDGKKVKQDRVANRLDVQVKAFRAQAEKMLATMEEEGLENIKIRLTPTMAVSIWFDKEG